jgi:hypothetical protein
VVATTGAAVVAASADVGDATSATACVAATVAAVVALGVVAAIVAAATVGAAVVAAVVATVVAWVVAATVAAVVGAAVAAVVGAVVAVAGTVVAAIVLVAAGWGVMVGVGLPHALTSRANASVASRTIEGRLLNMNPLQNEKLESRQHPE